MKAIIVGTGAELIDKGSSLVACH